MIGTMWDTGLYPPLYRTRPQTVREVVICVLLNENRPTVWEQVSDYIDRHGSVSNTEVRQLMATVDVLAASKQIKKWVELGQLVLTNANAAKRLRRYAKPGLPLTKPLFEKVE